ncbi:hypothetical protein DFH07DRAFT_406897 [Mycena maculata]|uniref:Uncharacterized protein n=1 Tax=Mycena maculata TaxID=230809 RepID=A0AAD7JFG3_9AGAR|nr:hypothetical protein DFH07DRAFT_406897 [Mycena maculata]
MAGISVYGRRPHFNVKYARLLTFFLPLSFWHVVHNTMSPWRQESTILVCLGALLVASVGFSLSVLATLLALFVSTSRPGQPIIEIRDAAVKASPINKAPSRSASKRRQRPEKLLLDVKADPEEAQLSLSPVPLSPLPQSTAPAQTVHVHFLTPTQEVPSIAVTPPPTRSFSIQSESSHETNTSYEASETSVHSSGPADSRDTRGRRRSRFSKIVHFFGDKRARVERRLSLSSLQSDESAAAATPPVKSLSSPPPTPGRSASEGRRSSLVMRVASCPALHHSHTCSGSSVDEPLPDPHPCPISAKKAEKEKKEKEKEAAPRPRTRPYEAPYFIPPPDAVDVEEPVPRRRPSRRRTTSDRASVI